MYTDIADRHGSRGSLSKQIRAIRLHPCSPCTRPAVRKRPADLGLRTQPGLTTDEVTDQRMKRMGAEPTSVRNAVPAIAPEAPPGLHVSCDAARISTQARLDDRCLVTTHRYSYFHSLVQRIAGSAVGAWILSRSMHHLDRVVLSLTGGRATAAGWLAGLPMAMLEVKGARSGVVRTLPLICVQVDSDADRPAFVATNWGRARHPAWYYNLKANPEVACTVAGVRRLYTAYEASADEYERFWRRAVETYAGYRLYQRRIRGRHIPIMILAPRRA